MAPDKLYHFLCLTVYHQGTSAALDGSGTDAECGCVLRVHPHSPAVPEWTAHDTQQRVGVVRRPEREQPIALTVVGVCACVRVCVRGLAEREMPGRAERRLRLAGEVELSACGFIGAARLRRPSPRGLAWRVPRWGAVSGVCDHAAARRRRRGLLIHRLRLKRDEKHAALSAPSFFAHYLVG